MDHIGDYVASLGEKFIYLGFRAELNSPLIPSERSGELVTVKHIGNRWQKYRYVVQCRDGFTKTLGYFELGFVKPTSLEEWL